MNIVQCAGTNWWSCEQTITKVEMENSIVKCAEGMCVNRGEKRVGEFTENFSSSKEVSEHQKEWNFYD